MKNRFSIIGFCSTILSFSIIIYAYSEIITEARELGLKKLQLVNNQNFLRLISLIFGLSGLIFIVKGKLKYENTKLFILSLFLIFFGAILAISDLWHLAYLLFFSN
jgi:hypothetical protein